VLGDLARHPAQLFVQLLALDEISLERVLDADRDALDSSSSPRESIPRARSRSTLPTLPGSSRRSPSSESAASAPTVSTPAARSRSSAFGPTPGSLRTSSGARKPASWPGTTTTSPPGLRASLPTFATTLHGATPSEHVRLVAPPHGRLYRFGDDARLEKSAATSPTSR
jgi:hypothetical protein